MADPRCTQIAPEQTWSLRQLVLRAGRPLAASCWDGDDLESTHHFGLFDGAVLVGISSLYERPHDVAPPPGAWQLRGMAVLPERQGSGLGGLMLRYVLDFCRDRLAGRTVWCNARTRAVPFYTRRGFLAVGDEFIIEDVGPHLVMLRPLDERPAG